jgi:transmembrane sensor
MTDFDFDRLGEQLAREQDTLLAKHNVQGEVRARIAELDVGTLHRSAGTTATRRAGVVWAIGGGGAVLAAAAVALVALRGLPLDVQGKTLSVQLSETGSNVEVGQYVHVPPAKEFGLDFSDGSHIAVAEHSRVRLTGLRTNGADVSLESGLMRVQVKHRDNTSWHISAGPFGVHVIGTRFDVRWKPEDDNFEVTLHEGKVELSGCAFSAGYRMVAGQTVRTACKNGRFAMESIDGSSAAAAGSGSVESFAVAEQAAAAEAQPEAQVQPAPQVQAPSPSEATPAPREKAAADKPGSSESKSTKDSRSDFRALARAGLYAAKAVGFEQECARATARDLSLLATAARYAQDTVSEAYALRLLRDKFRGTKDASIAAFALGRIEFDNHGAYAKAAEWFRTYLREQPRGDLTREALGRLLEATQHLGDRAQVRELAGRYLNDYPDGPHASLAQRLRGPEVSALAP